MTARHPWVTWIRIFRCPACGWAVTPDAVYHKGQLAEPFTRIVEPPTAMARVRAALRCLIGQHDLVDAPYVSPCRRCGPIAPWR